MVQTYKEQIKAKKDIVAIIEDIEVKGLIWKRAVIQGSNVFYNCITITHDYKTGKVLNEDYSNIHYISIKPAFA